MVKLIFIRHGMTKANEEKRYVGRTDEMLSLNGAMEIEQKITENRYPEADAVFVSWQKRCIQTAKLIYPFSEYVQMNDFSELNFGDFEMKTYEELKDDADYRKFIETRGMTAPRGGESKDVFVQRTRRGMHRVINYIKDYLDEIKIAYSKSYVKNKPLCEEDFTFACILNGGTIMQIMSEYLEDAGDYYDYSIGCSDGYEVELMSGDDNTISLRMIGRL